MQCSDWWVWLPKQVFGGEIWKPRWTHKRADCTHDKRSHCAVVWRTNGKTDSIEKQLGGRRAMWTKLLLLEGEFLLLAVLRHPHAHSKTLNACAWWRTSILVGSCFIHALQWRSEGQTKQSQNPLPIQNEKKISLIRFRMQSGIWLNPMTWFF